MESIDATDTVDQVSDMAQSSIDQQESFVVQVDPGSVDAAVNMVRADANSGEDHMDSHTGGHFLIGDETNGEEPTFVIDENDGQNIEYSMVCESTSGFREPAVVYSGEAQQFIGDDQQIKDKQTDEDLQAVDSNTNDYTVSVLSEDKLKTNEEVSKESAAMSRILENLPMMEIVDEMGKVSTISELPPGSQIILDPSYKGLSDLPPGSQIILDTGEDGSALATLSSGTGSQRKELSSILPPPASRKTRDGNRSTNRNCRGTKRDSTFVQVLGESRGNLSGAENETSSKSQKMLTVRRHSEKSPSSMSNDFVITTDERQSEELDQGPPSNMSKAADKQEWKWFKDSDSGRKPSKYTCKVFDAVVATVSSELLHNIKKGLDPDAFPDNCSLLEHLLVTKHHVTDLMIREDSEELQLAGDLIDIMEVHNVLLGNLVDQKCAHKPFQSCAAVMKDQGIMCSGVPQPAAMTRGGRKMKKIYTKDMYVHVPATEGPGASDTPEVLSSDPEILPTRAATNPKENNWRSSGRISRPPVKMGDSVEPAKKKRGRKPYKRAKPNPEPKQDPIPAVVEDAAEQSSNVISFDKGDNDNDTEALENDQGNEVTEQEVTLVLLKVESTEKATDDLTTVIDAEGSEELTALDPIVDRPEMLNGLDLLNNIKHDEQPAMSMDPAPMTTPTVDKFLPIIAAQDTQSEDEALLPNSSGLDRQAETIPTTTSTMPGTFPIPSQTYKKPKKKKKDYESEAPFKYFCNKCSFKTKRESHFHKHSLLHTEKNMPVLYCSRCDYSTLTLSRLRHHEVVHTPNAYKCIVCPYKTISMQQLRKHHHKKHEMKASSLTLPGGEQTCVHCDYTTDKVHLFQRHSQCHSHVSGNKSGVAGMMIPSYSCTHCPYTSKKKENFLRHVENVHCEARPYLCDLCGVGFKRKDTLKAHRQVHLDKTQRTYKYSCSICKKGVRSKGHLDEHMSMHSSKRQYLCEICGASFKTRGIQRRHVFTIHKNPKSYPCPTCKKLFNTKFALHRHNRTHELAQLRVKGLHSPPPQAPVSMAIKEDSIPTPAAAYVKVSQGMETVTLPAVHESGIIHIQPMAFPEQGLGGDQVITELQVLPMETSLDTADINTVGHQEVDQIVDQGYDGEQKVEVQIQPALVQTDTGATTLLYLTAVPQDVN